MPQATSQAPPQARISGGLSKFKLHFFKSVQVRVCVPLAQGLQPEQVQLGARAANQAGESVAEKLAPDGAANQAAVAGDVNAGMLIHIYAA